MSMMSAIDASMRERGHDALYARDLATVAEADAEIARILATPGSADAGVYAREMSDLSFYRLMRRTAQNAADRLFASHAAMVARAEVSL